MNIRVMALLSECLYLSRNQHLLSECSQHVSKSASPKRYTLALQTCLALEYSASPGSRAELDISIQPEPPQAQRVASPTITAVERSRQIESKICISHLSQPCNGALAPRLTLAAPRWRYCPNKFANIRLQ